MDNIRKSKLAVKLRKTGNRRGLKCAAGSLLFLPKGLK
jgi:hypothetical protein